MRYNTYADLENEFGFLDLETDEPYHAYCAAMKFGPLSTVPQVGTLFDPARKSEPCTHCFTPLDMRHA